MYRCHRLSVPLVLVLAAHTASFCHFGLSMVSYSIFVEVSLAMSESGKTIAMNENMCFSL